MNTQLLIIAQAVESETITAKVDWMQEIINGGITSIALILLFLVAIAITIERLFHLKRSRFIPKGFIKQVNSLNENQQWDDLRSLCTKNKSLSSKVILFMLERSNAESTLLIDGSFEIISRAMRKENQINFFLAVIASLAPLLGLLGTMIGMIESFKLVEIYGDEGGASMLAGSISKALITTALGLIIAIFSLILYHWNKHRINDVTHEVEEEMERLMNNWYLK